MEFEVGSIVEGKVTGVKSFGAFVELPGNKTGMVHISEVSNEYIQDLSTVLTQGQIALSIKRTVERPARSSRSQRSDGGRVWQPRRSEPAGEMSFEDMMAKFKSQSEEKISDLKRVTEARRGGGYSRRR